MLFRSVGVKMGGKDVVYVNQQYSSPLQPADIQKKLKDVADKRFTDASRPSSTHNDKKENSTENLSMHTNITKVSNR